MLKTRRSRWVLLGAAVILAALVGIAAAFGVRIRWQPATAFEQAQARWQAANIDSYQATVLAQVPFRAEGVYFITVEDGTVTQAEVVNIGAYRFSENPPRAPLDPSQGDPFTMAALLQYAERLTSDLPAFELTLAGSSRITYDPETGHVQELVQNNCGVLFMNIDECLLRYEVLVFEAQ